MRVSVNSILKLINCNFAKQIVGFLFTAPYLIFPFLFLTVRLRDLAVDIVAKFQRTFNPVSGGQCKFIFFPPKIVLPFSVFPCGEENTLSVFSKTIQPILEFFADYDQGGDDYRQNLQSRFD